jgi:hypothetical protein
VLGISTTVEVGFASFALNLPNTVTAVSDPTGFANQRTAIDAHTGKREAPRLPALLGPVGPYTLVAMPASSAQGKRGKQSPHPS